MSGQHRTLTEKTVSGAAWLGAGRIMTQVLTLVVMITVARFLTPKAYGVFGMARIATGFIEIFRDLGASSAIIQRREIDEELLSSVFWANLILGILTALITVIASSCVAAFYHEPEIAPVMRALSAGFILMSIGAVPAAVMNREMAFKKITLIELAASLAASVMAIFSLFLGAGLWSLVISVLATSAASTTLFFYISGWRPHRGLTWLQIRSIASYSLNLSGFNVLNYFNRNADNAIVGRYLGATPLGYYQLAYNIMLYAVQNLTAVIGRALFPAFTKVQDDNVRFRNAYVKGVSMIAAITFPLMAALMGTATPLVQVAFGPKWHPVAQLLVILAPVGLIQSVVSNVGQIYFAKGRTDWMLRWGLLSAVVVIPSFFLGLNWGISGIAWAYLIANVLLLYPALAIPFHLIELRMNTFLKPLLPILGCSLLMLCVLLLITPQIQAWKAPDQLVTLICAGMATYSVALLVIRPAAAMHFLSLKKASRKVVREAS